MSRFSCKWLLNFINNFLSQRIRNQIRKCPGYFREDSVVQCSAGADLEMSLKVYEMCWAPRP